jgi:hypothetical protein
MFFDDAVMLKKFGEMPNDLTMLFSISGAS